MTNPRKKRPIAARGLTQVQIAERVGCAQSTVSRAVARGDLAPLADGSFPPAAVDVLWSSLQYERRRSPREPMARAPEPPEETFALTAAELAEIVARVPASAHAAAKVGPEDEHGEDCPPEFEACVELEHWVRELLGIFAIGDPAGPSQLEVLRALAVALAARTTMCGRGYGHEAQTLWRAVAALASVNTTTTSPRSGTKET